MCVLRSDPNSQSSKVEISEEKLDKKESKNRPEIGTKAKPIQEIIDIKEFQDTVELPVHPFHQERQEDNLMPKEPEAWLSGEFSIELSSKSELLSLSGSHPADTQDELLGPLDEPVKSSSLSQNRPTKQPQSPSKNFSEKFKEMAQELSPHKTPAYSAWCSDVMPSLVVPEADPSPIIDDHDSSQPIEGHIKATKTSPEQFPERPIVALDEETPITFLIEAFRPSSSQQLKQEGLKLLKKLVKNDNPDFWTQNYAQVTNDLHTPCSDYIHAMPMFSLIYDFKPINSFP